MAFDDLDDLLNGDDELEAAFRELDAQIKLDELRAKGPRRGKETGRRGASGSSRSHGTSAGTADPLADLKTALDGDASPPKRATKVNAPKSQGARYLVVVCPDCGGKNRVPLARLRKSLPICGRCKRDLSFER